MGALEVGLLGLGAYSAYRSARSKDPKTPDPVHTTQTVSGEQEGRTRKVKKYRPPAQQFANEDLRLGMAGQLGM